MKRNFIFIFILLATLSMVNAVPTKLHKRVTIFQPCPKTPLDVTKIVPDPLISGAKGKFYVSGKIAKVIPKGYILAALYFDISTDTPKLIDYSAANLCLPDGALACPYPANALIDVVLGVKIPPLPATYGLAVAIGDGTLNVVLGCASAVVDGAPAAPKAPAPAPPPGAPSAPPPPPPTSPPPAPASSPSASAPSPAPSGKGAGGIQDILLSDQFNL